MKVGFIDHHLNNYHADKFFSIFKDGKAGDGIEIVAAYESHPDDKEDWCLKNGVPKAGSAAEVVEKADAIMVLAPDNFEAHLVLSAEAVRSGKPVLIDKALAKNLEDARTIISDAHNAGTPVMSASPLRFSMELEELIARVGEGPYDGIFSRGFGKWRGYAVHSIQPALRLLGGRVKRVIDTGQGSNHNITIENADGRRAVVEIRECDNQFDATPWQIGVLRDKKYEIVTVKQFDEFYVNLLKEAVQFFRTGQSPVPVEEMLDEVMVEVAADSSFNSGGQWVEVGL